jgi:hypothetical protein
VLEVPAALVSPSETKATIPLDFTEGGAVPDMFKCPITGDIMNDPVAVVSGSLYERSAITTWLEKECRDPLTNLPLSFTDQSGARHPCTSVIRLPAIREFMTEWQTLQQLCRKNAEEVEHLKVSQQFVCAWLMG